MARYLLASALLAALSARVQAATVTYDLNVTWVTANPDGLADRPTIGVNGKWPPPTLRADVGDTVIVNLENQLGNQSTSAHFHGLYMEDTPHMDGPVQVSQCAVPPGGKMKYNFTVNQPGTYWYHSHEHGQYPDGFRAPFIINDPKSPFKDMYDEEIELSVSDWYHDQMPGLLDFFISKGNPTGAEPVPNSGLWNDTHDLHVPVQPGKTYFVRLVNVGAFAAMYIWFEGHNITIIEVDGVYHNPAEAEMIYVTPAQRVGFLLTTKDETSANFPFVASMDLTLFDVMPDDLSWNITGWLVYDEKNELPASQPLDELEPFDDAELVPYDNMTILGAPDVTVTLDVIMDNLGDGANYAFFNDITYKSPKVPTLYTALSAGQQATNPDIYGKYTNSHVLEKDAVVDIVLNNLDTGKHPFHLHGHAFQTIYRSDDEAGTFADSNITEADFFPTPMRRDTVTLNPEGFVILRFKADHAGAWLFHCHIEWHMSSGLIATFITDPIGIQAIVTIPEDHLAVCRDANVPTKGNAAGNSVDFLNLDGEPVPPKPLPAGFTARGIVALVFSCITGILGVIVVAWYGLAEVPKETHHSGSGIVHETDAAPQEPYRDAPAQNEEVYATTGGGTTGTRA